MSSLNLYFPNRLIFGAGALNDLNAQSLPGKKALIVTSSGKSFIKNGSLERLKKQLAISHIDSIHFSGIQANPSRESVMEGAALARKENCDIICALGGGSVIDASKAIAIMVTNSGDIWDYIEGGTGKGLPIKNKPLPIIAINTTAGTGSEADKYGVISNHSSNEKVAFGGDDALYPVISVVDPELMLSIPPHLTAYQGFDALFHAIECYMGVNHNLMSDTFAMRNIELIGKYLARAVNNGEDIEAREGMAFASYIAGNAMMCSGTVAAHALEHAMSAYHPTLPHGAGLIMISREFYTALASNPDNEERLIKIAHLLGNSSANSSADFVSTLLKLEAECHVDSLSMSDYQISPDEFPSFADNAYATMAGAFDVTPVKFDKELCISIYQKSYK